MSFFPAPAKAPAAKAARPHPPPSAAVQADSRACAAKKKSCSTIIALKAALRGVEPRSAVFNQFFTSIAFILFTPADTFSCFAILNVPRTPVRSTWGPPHISLEKSPIV